MPRGLGGVQKKILLLLAAGVGLSVSRSAGDHYRIVKEVVGEWKKINQRSLRSAIRSLYESRSVGWVEKLNGVIELTLTDGGRNKVLKHNPYAFKITKPEKWDGKWRVMVFDIPEVRREVRDALRGHLRQMGFYELQKSVFVHPYPCSDIFNFLVEIYNIRRHVRFITADDLDSSLHLKHHFNLL